MKVGVSPEYVGSPVGFLAITQHFVVVGMVMMGAEGSAWNDEIFWLEVFV